MFTVIARLAGRETWVAAMTRTPVILGCVILLVCGCFKVGPQFARPPVRVAPAWLDANDPRLKTAAADYRGWWHAFNDPALNGLIERAYRENLSLQSAGARVLQARAQLGITVGEFYPQTQQATGSLQYNRLSGSSPQAAFTQDLKYWQSEIGLLAGWELDFWGKFRRAIESDSAAWLATVADYDNALVSLTADVAVLYIRIRTGQRRLVIARQNAAIQQENLEIAEVKVQWGLAAQLDVDQAQTILNNTLASIPTLESQVRQDQDALGVLLGLPPGPVTDLVPEAGEIPVSAPQVVAGIPADLLRRRPDVRSAEFQAAAQCARIGVAKADLYPAFSLNGTFGFLASDVGGPALGALFEWKSRTVQAGPAFQWNVFNYGRITNNVRLQDARFQELLLAYQNIVLTAQREVQDNLVAFLKAQDRAEFLARSTAFAKSSLELATVQYQQGAKDFLSVLAAQLALLNAQDNLASTLGDISISLVGVYKALGGGWEIREGKDLLAPEVREEMAKRTHWGKLLAPASYNPPASEEPQSRPRPPDW
jgi:NodT family efflux transporter outer membrane factor (OMF) lipoprotein